MTEKNIRHSIKGDNDEAVIMPQRLEKTNAVMTVLFLTDDKHHSVNIRFYNYYKMDYRDITDEFYRKLNEMNSNLKKATHYMKNTNDYLRGLIDARNYNE